MTEVSYHRLAYRELRKARDWYAKHSRAVARRFLDAVDVAVSQIGENPRRHPIEQKHYRWVRLRRFPYRLIFEEQSPGRVLIVAVAHSHRRPGYWSKRK